MDTSKQKDKLEGKERSRTLTGKNHSYLVKAWNYSSFPAYKSRFWNKEAQAKGGVSTGISK